MKHENASERVRQASRSRRATQKEALRQTILRAAAGLFAEQGYDGFSMRQVAERIGYTPTSIYLYFSDKDALLFAILDEAFVRFTQQLTAAAATSTDPVERIVAIGQAYLSFGLQHPEHYQLMFVQRGDFLMQTRANEQEPRYTTFHLLQRAVQAAMDGGHIRPGPVESISDALWALVHGLVSLAISFPLFDAARVERAAEAAVRLVIAGLRRD
ncbi:MAG TPA: TetR/AcrR family transcriptional regulator [Chloroflexia bacterium]|nr:TetR/AcrR family transcriptional regulator [Chloroflexia bacterium]